MSKTVYLVIGDAGDGSNFLEWHRTMTPEKQELMESKDEYQSGDGVQITELEFPDDFDLDLFAKANCISWHENDQDDADE